MNHMNNTSNVERCIQYLELYSQKDLNGVQQMFADDIVLRDWKIRVVGKELALEETRKNFEEAESIAIDVLATYESADTVAAELKITVNHDEELFVVDVVSFNKLGEINSIRAYLGRGDQA